MIVSGNVNNKTSVYKTLYECYKKTFKKQYDYCIKHAVWTVIFAFGLTMLLNVFGASVHLDIALVCHICCGLLWFFSDRWALRSRFKNHSWNVEAGYIVEEPVKADEESRAIMSEINLRVFTVRNMRGDCIGMTCGTDDVNKNLSDGCLVWFNCELGAVFPREGDTDENGEIK